MKNKIRTFDEGLNYLYQAKKDYRPNFFGLANLEMFRRLFGLIGGIEKLFHRKAKDSDKASEEIVHGTSKKPGQNPWRTLAYVVCVSFVAGVVTRKILAAKQKT
jgi:hypothetical protein